MKYRSIFAIMASVILLLSACDNNKNSSNISNSAESNVQAKTKSHVGQPSSKQGKKVLILSSSPRKEGNSDLLCNQFMKGAQEAGHQVEKIYLNDMKINFFTSDNYADMTGASNPADDAPAIVEKMVHADVIVMATPVYFYTMCGQMKTMIDRTYERYSDIKDKEFYYILTAADKDKETLQRTVEEFRGFLDCIPNPVECGIIYGVGAWEKGSVKSLPVMDETYQMGKNS